jgi:predicted nuclease of predicted toxin-antitoxin system
MRFKLDENLDPRLAASLTAAGHDVSTVPAQRLSGRSDETIYAVCLAEARILGKGVSPIILNFRFKIIGLINIKGG